MFTGAMAAIAAAGAVASAGAGIMSASAGGKAAAASNAVAYRNYLLQREIAQKQLELAQATQTDARGNKVKYIPGVGWVTETTEQTRGVLSASDNEERLRLSRDAVISRLGRTSQFDRQLNEAADADAVRYALGADQRRPEDIRGLLMLRNAARATSGADEAVKQIGMQALRGGSGAAEALGAVSRNAMPSLRAAIAEAQVEAPAQYEAERSASRGQRLNEYGLLAGRATTPIGEVAAPTTIDNDLASLLASRINSSSGSSGYIGYGLRNPDIKSTEDKTPLAIGNFGAALSGIAKDPDLQKFLRGLSSSNYGYNNSNTLPIPMNINPSGSGSGTWGFNVA